MTEQIGLLALGSNLGDRAANIHNALDALNAHPEITVQETAFLYETPPAYVLDQPSFLNTACQIATSLSPQDLLTALKRMEVSLGREKSVRFGPRRIDLDILFYDDLALDEPALTIPHPRLAERDFVLVPLLDLAPDWVDPVTGKSVADLWADLGAARLPRVMPAGRGLWRWDQGTYIMGVLNVTPDSFSGDGLYDSVKVVDEAVELAWQMADQGADLLDVGGYSTRPNHKDVAIEQEIVRVVPVIQALRKAVPLPISIDTFRTPVARAALEAGADWINDVWGLRLFPDLAELSVQHRAPLVMMHNRTRALAAYADRLKTSTFRAHFQQQGDPYDYQDVALDVRRELAQSLSLARDAGVPRWLRLIDPGIGFGKNPDQHLTLIRHLDRVADLDYPLLFGASRKGFVGKILGGLDAHERDEGSMALNVMAVERGANIVRVHNVQMTVRALGMVDAVMMGR